MRPASDAGEQLPGTYNLFLHMSGQNRLKARAPKTTKPAGRRRAGLWTVEAFENQAEAECVK
ncbi:uncharacterized protein BDCG_00182 [Blastomyces dermatitidis ER-3]|uniref:Uncharacterized protein n=1 Tax=Ajellomyces dermatitidis (strain ER-3 / ATCC MYA-2586) TaxID=559297 RepID=A0ABP2EJW8_AJEDR|nr:uncharacterized protein BDCG_00182 [Blastomyces dermatitidis ER-3]EEQ83377.2 hypothetical protein BDCG_00182 [Blastomyces dermatitidis ER-3]EQL35912.1 hypothetical protein BDFG_02515 [Blastomyces dermatitidis ATCC 26199]